MSGDLEADGGDRETDTIQKDTDAITHETKGLVIEARSSLVILICTILIFSILSILLSTWIAKTITNTPTSFGTILTRYFGFDRNESEPILTWWTPIHTKIIKTQSQESSIASNQSSNSTTKLHRVSHSDFPRFNTIGLPLLLIGAILMAILAYLARIRCTDHGFGWGAVPKLPLGRIDLNAAAPSAIVKSKQAEPGIDYTIVQGTKADPVVFALAETLKPLNEPEKEREPGSIVDEGTQYDLEDIPKTITRVSSAPQLAAENQTVPSSTTE